MTFNEWLMHTKGKDFETYFNEYPHGISHFEYHLIDLKMSYITYCKENNIPMIRQ